MRKKQIEMSADEFGKEYAGLYEFQEITWAKRSRIMQKNTRYHPRTGTVISSDYVRIAAETCIAALAKQPKGNPITLEKLLAEDREKGLPIELGEILTKAANEVCGVSREEEDFLEPASAAKPQTPK